MEFFANRYGVMRAGRFMAIQIPVPKLVGLLKKVDPEGGYQVVTNGLPEDAKIIRTSLDWLGPVQVLFIIAESEEWPVLSETEPIPLLSPSVHTARKGTGKPRKGTKEQGRGVDDAMDRPPFGPGSEEDPETFPDVPPEEDELPI